MTAQVGLLTYGNSGNTYNVKKALELAGASVTMIEKVSDLDSVDRIVMPGVGCFKDAMHNLAGIKIDLVEHIQKKPTLGICLGMQILAKVGYEFGETEGLNFIDAEVKKIEVKCKVPHLGWGTLMIVRDSPLLKGITEKHNFYFMHSYEMVNYTDVVSLTSYCDHKFVSVVQKGQIFGVQFHPEKSRSAGITLLKNFLELG
jgi:imidazole glycerol phosphate synthase glutamine amidotransferase subunit